MSDETVASRVVACRLYGKLAAVLMVAIETGFAKAMLYARTQVPYNALFADCCCCCVIFINVSGIYLTAPLSLLLLTPTDYEVRIEMCRQLPAIGRGIGSEHTAKLLLPELLQLLNDEEIPVRLAGFEALAELLAIFDPSTMRDTVIPLVKRLLRGTPEDMIKALHCCSLLLFVVHCCCCCCYYNCLLIAPIWCLSVCSVRV